MTGDARARARALSWDYRPPGFPDCPYRTPTESPREMKFLCFAKSHLVGEGEKDLRPGLPAVIEWYAPVKYPLATFDH